MSKIFLSASALALLVALPSAGLAASHTAKKDDTTSKKNADIKGEGIEIIATPKDEMAKSPGLEISGGTSFNAYSFAQFVKGSKGRGTHFGADDSRINFEVLGKTGPELGCVEYSFLIGLSGNTEAGTTSVEENRIKLKSAFGTFLGGVHRGVTDFMAVGAFNFFKGTGNVLGNYKSVINETSGSVIRDDLAGHGKDRTKLTLITPRFMFGEFGGIQFGYSFTPDGEQRGEAKVNTLTTAGATVKPAGQNLSEFAVNYKGEAANGFAAEVSFTALVGSAKMLTAANAAAAVAGSGDNYLNRRYDDIRSYAIGLVLSYAGFSIGGEYLNNGNSLGLTGFTTGAIVAASGLVANTNYNVTGGDSGCVYNIGVGYTYNKHSASIGYLKSNRDLGTANRLNVAGGVAASTPLGTVDSKVFSVSYDYKVAKGLKVYTEATHFNMCQSNPAGAAIWSNAATGSANTTDNNGHALIAGVALSF